MTTTTLRLLFCAEIMQTSGSKTFMTSNSHQIRSRSTVASRNKRRLMRKLSSSHKSTSGSLNVGNFVDYSTPPRIIPSPPPPPPREGIRRWLFPTTLAATAGLSIYVYQNNQNDSYEYWDAMQSGKVASFDIDEDEIDLEDDDV